MINLTQSQQRIVDCDSTYCLVSASAGSGKTLVLAKRIERLLVGLQRGEKILALTFTNKAARELRDRLIDTCSEKELSSKVFVGTIHSFCAEFVGRRGTTIGLPSDLHVFESEEDRLAILVDAVEAVPQMRAGITSDRALRQLLDEIGRAKRSQAFARQFFSDLGKKMVFEEYGSRLLIQHAVDFDDILVYSARILTEHPMLAMMYQKVYRYICIDEAQDLNDAQYEVVRALAGNECGIMMVGDSCQVIYGFNGSTATIMVERFPREYPANRYVLEENFRSSISVMRFAHAIEPAARMIPRLVVPGEATCHEFTDEVEEACWVTDRILELQANGSVLAAMERIPSERCAVLARNRYVLDAMQRVLDERNLSYSVRVAGGGAASSESDLFAYFHLGLRLMVNPNDQLHLSRLIAEFSPNGPYESFDEICASRGSYDGLTLQASEALRAAWTALSGDGDPRLDRALEVLKEACDDEGAFAADEDRSLAVNDCEQWVRWWERYCLSTASSSRRLSGFLRALSLGEVLDGQRDEGVTLSTVHLAKGLEFDAVFVIGMNDGTFPDYRSRTPEQLEEERHNMFVAITRSRRLCYVTRPKVRTMPWGERRSQIPSPFFMELQSLEPS